MNQQDFETAIAPLIQKNWVKPTVALIDAEMQMNAGHDLGHLLRVLRNARKIYDGEVARGEAVDWEIIAAAALLHDVVDLPKDHPDRSSASRQSAEKAAKHFRRLGAFGAEDIERIYHAIEAHSFSAGIESRSIEAKIVCDADRLESVGAFGIARVFLVSGQLGGMICDMADPFARDRELDDVRYTVDHFYSKMLKLTARLYTPSAREIGAQRHQFMKTYLAQLADEIGEPLKEEVVEPMAG